MNALNCLEKTRPQLTGKILSVHVSEYLRFVAIRRYPSDESRGVSQLLCVQGRLRKQLLQINAFRSIAVDQSNLIDHGLRTALAEYPSDTRNRSNPSVSDNLRHQMPQPCLSFGVQGLCGQTHRVCLREIPCRICLHIVCSRGRPS